LYWIVKCLLRLLLKVQEGDNSFHWLRGPPIHPIREYSNVGGDEDTAHDRSIHYDGQANSNADLLEHENLRGKEAAHSRAQEHGGDCNSSSRGLNILGHGGVVP